MRTYRTIWPALALLVTSAACGDHDSAAEPSSAVENAIDAPTTDASVDPVVTLRLGTNDPDDAPIAPTIAAFASAVADVSGGSMQIEPVWRAAGDPAPDDWDQAVASRVINGSIEMGLIPSAAFDAVGVTTLRGLNAPFLIDSDPLTRSVVADSELSSELMAGLGSVGLTGVGMIPESMRHVFSFSGPLAAPADFSGVTIRSPRSDTVAEVFAALGAKVDDPAGSAFEQAVGDGLLAGAESSFGRAASLPSATLVSVGNEPLFPKVNVMVVNDAAFARLDDEQRQVLRDAVAQVNDSLTPQPDDAAEAAQFCADFGDVVLATDEQRAALRTAVQPVYDALDADPATKAIISAIDDLKADAQAPPPVTACQHQADEVIGTLAPADAIPFGTFNRTVTKADGAALDPAVVDDILGIDGQIPISLEISDGTWKLYVTEDDGSTSIGDLGTYGYDASGNLVTTSVSGGCHGCAATIAWTVANGTLTLHLIPTEGVRVPTEGVRPPNDDEILMTDGDYVLQP